MLYELDVIATQAINAQAGKSVLLDHFFLLVTQIGVPLLILAVVLQWWRRPAGAVREAARHQAVICGLSFLLGLAINQLVLLFVQRLRPYDAGVSHLLLTPTTDPSFPSDHATAAFAILFGQATRLRAAVGAELGRGWLRLAGFLLGALLVVTSRVYLGTHYVSDILGGMGTAFLAVCITRAVYRPRTRLDRWVTSIL